MSPSKPNDPIPPVPDSSLPITPKESESVFKHPFIQKPFKILEQVSNKTIFLPFGCLVAFVDIFIAVIPLDAFFFAGIYLQPKKKISICFAIALGTALGALLIGYLTQMHGLPLIEQHFPSLPHSTLWVKSEEILGKHGILGYFFLSLLPLAITVPAIIASLAHLPLSLIFWICLAGKMIKYVTYVLIIRKFPAFSERFR